MKRFNLLSLLALIVGIYLAGCAVVIGPPQGRIGVAPPPPIVVETEPRVVLIPGTEVYYAPDVAANIYVVGGLWYYFHDGHWFHSRSYRGPWAFTEERRLPSGLRRLPPGFRNHPPGRGVIPPGQLKRRERDRDD
jgi:hypothetical protein